MKKLTLIFALITTIVVGQNKIKNLGYKKVFLVATNGILKHTFDEKLKSKKFNNETIDVFVFIHNADTFGIIKQDVIELRNNFFDVNERAEIANNEIYLTQFSYDKEGNEVRSRYTTPSAIINYKNNKIVSIANK